MCYSFFALAGEKRITHETISFSVSTHTRLVRRRSAVSLAFRRFSLLAALALLAAFAPLARPALAANFTVNTLTDSAAAGTLRWAITSANASAGQDTISFSVAGTITLTSPLPALTD